MVTLIETMLRSSLLKRIKNRVVSFSAYMIQWQQEFLRL
ncbi:hypothetical protein SynMITS9220_01755 [Synechococcus sp. MIT S9220]|nr:hypothetical protein SynMITS9220_01755 [Synechococcus sp. MIT S9220]